MDIKEQIKKGCGKQINQIMFCGEKFLDGSFILCSECEKKQNENNQSIILQTERRNK